LGGNMKGKRECNSESNYVGTESRHSTSSRIASQYNSVESTRKSFF
jgi:hypothetical protein